MENPLVGGPRRLSHWAERELAHQGHAAQPGSHGPEQPGVQRRGVGAACGYTQRPGQNLGRLDTS